MDNVVLKLKKTNSECIWTNRLIPSCIQSNTLNATWYKNERLRIDKTNRLKICSLEEISHEALFMRMINYLKSANLKTKNLAMSFLITLILTFAWLIFWVWLTIRIERG